MAKIGGLVGFLVLALSVTAVAQEKCRKHGTAVEWEESVEAARAKAEIQGKLLLVLHVSGRFEDPEFT